MLLFRIRGTIREQESGIGLPGLRVKAYDKDLVYDDLMGATWTGADGRFEIVSEESDFRDFLEVRPDIYLRILSPDAQSVLYSTEDAVRWQGTTVEHFHVEIPREYLGEHAPPRGIELLGDEGEPRAAWDAGESLNVHVHGVRPERVHDVVLRADDGNELFTDQVLSDRHGTIGPVTVWPQMGMDDPRTDERFGYEQAARRWQGRTLKLEVRDGQRSVAETGLRFADRFSRPAIFHADADGVVLNGFEAGRHPVVLVGHNLAHRGRARIYMVRSQADWRLGDRFEPVRLESGRLAQQDVELGDAPLRAVLARPREVAPGSYDFIIRPLRYGYEDDEFLTVRRSDWLSSRRITGLVVRAEFMAAKAVLGGCVNANPMSGRGISGRPYFQYADTFEIGEDVYAALDPNALDPNNQSKMVALYVIQHKAASAWATDSSLTHLPQLGGNAAVQKFKTQTSCINFNKRLIWSNATDVGEYDVVADFGNNVADSSAFVTDASFDAPLDLIDGYFVSGFRVIEDPTTHTTFAHAGKHEYTQATEGTVTVDDDSSTGTVVPMNGVVYFPADDPGGTSPAQISAVQSSYPMFIAVHGQSGATNSYHGYNYLLEHMARNGFIAASVHCNVGMQGTGRARVMFAHIDLLKIKFGSKAANNIGIMGHSRGGEAVAIAPRLNQQEGLGHDIRATIPLAPTDQYTDEDVDAAPLLVIYGSMDGDVASPTNNGFRIYDRASTEKKSMVFVYGSTHGRYNTVWGDTDIDAWWSKLGPTDIPKLIDADAHQKIAKGYMNAFCRWRQLGEDKWAGTFRGEWIPQAVKQANGGDVDLYIQYQDDEPDQRRIVDDFQGPHGAASWQTSTIGGAVEDDNTLPVDPSQNELNALDGHSPHDTGGLLLRWDQSTDRLRFVVPAASQDVSGYETLSFRVAQRVDSPHNPVDQLQDLYVTLQDGASHTRSVKVGKLADIPPPHTRHNNQYTLSAMRTMRIPLHVFEIKVINTDEIDLSDVESVTFDFKAKATGELEIDSVEFTQ